jgi:hypothetical protein
MVDRAEPQKLLVGARDARLSRWRTQKRAAGPRGEPPRRSVVISPATLGNRDAGVANRTER